MARFLPNTTLHVLCVALFLSWQHCEAQNILDEQPRYDVPVPQDFKKQFDSVRRMFKEQLDRAVGAIKPVDVKEEAPVPGSPSQSPIPPADTRAKTAPVKPSTERPHRDDTPPKTAREESPPKGESKPRKRKGALEQYGFNIGEKIKTTVSLNVRHGAGLRYGKVLSGGVPAGTEGRIRGGPTPSDGYYWWKVKYSYAGGFEGWSVQDRLTLITPRVEADLSGTQVKVTGVGVGGLPTREGPSVDKSLIETLPENTIGKVIAGPTQNEGYVWWKIHWRYADVSGWSIQRYLNGTTLPSGDPTPPATAKNGDAQQKLQPDKIHEEDLTKKASSEAEQSLGRTLPNADETNSETTSVESDVTADSGKSSIRYRFLGPNESPREDLTGYITLTDPQSERVLVKIPFENGIAFIERRLLQGTGSGEIRGRFKGFGEIPLSAYDGDPNSMSDMDFPFEQLAPHANKIPDGEE